MALKTTQVQRVLLRRHGTIRCYWSHEQCLQTRKSLNLTFHKAYASIYSPKNALLSNLHTGTRVHVGYLSVVCDMSRRGHGSPIGMFWLVFVKVLVEGILRAIGLIWIVACDRKCASDEKGTTAQWCGLPTSALLRNERRFYWAPVLSVCSFGGRTRVQLLVSVVAGWCW